MVFEISFHCTVENGKNEDQIVGVELGISYKQCISKWKRTTDQSNETTWGIEQSGCKVCVSNIK